MRRELCNLASSLDCSVGRFAVKDEALRSSGLLRFDMSFEEIQSSRKFQSCKLGQLGSKLHLQVEW